MTPTPLASRVVVGKHRSQGVDPNLLRDSLLGARWKGERILCHSDNTAVVYTISKGSARDPHLMQILRTLYFFCTAFDLAVTAQHIPGVLNSSVGALLRNNLALFFSLHPQASPLSTPVSQDLRNLALTRALL